MKYNAQSEFQVILVELKPLLSLTRFQAFSVLQNLSHSPKHSSLAFKTTNSYPDAPSQMLQKLRT